MNEEKKHHEHNNEGHEHHKHEEHHEHKTHHEHHHKKDDEISISKTGIWQGISALLLLLLVVSIFTGGFGYSGTGTAVGQEKSGTIDANGVANSNSKISDTTMKNVPNVALEGAHMEGDPNAPVTIVEWSDFECPYCGRFYSQTYDQIVSKYIDTGKANFVFKHFPLSFHAQAQKAAEASECAAEQGKFWEMHNMLFKNGVEGGVATFKKYATALALDTDKFNSCLDSDKYASKIKADMADGQKNGVKGTPGFIINGKLVSGAQPFSVFQAAIEGAGDGSAPAAAAPTPVPSAPAKVDVSKLNMEGAHVKGDANAPVTIVEWSDFECPYCGRFHSQTYGQIVENYVDKGDVKFVYKQFPLSFHPQAQKAAEASECAAEQDKFWEMHDMLFESGVAGGVTSFKTYAKDLGLDTAKFDSCLDSGKYNAKIKADVAEGQASGIRGTPGFLIDGKLVSGAQPYEVFKAAIDAALA